jgi:hypothetical protein
MILKKETPEVICKQFHLQHQKLKLKKLFFFSDSLKKKINETEKNVENAK